MNAIIPNNNTRQTCNHLLMIRPAHFGYNPETEKSNTFQSDEDGSDTELIKRKAIEEFDEMVRKIGDCGISVTIIEDSTTPEKSDAIFPNNWISFHENGTIVTYPMAAGSRRLERREDILEEIGEKFEIEKRYSFEYYETKNKFLEGTGSMVLDRIHKIVYACLSARTDIQLLEKFAVLLGYSKCVFHAFDKNGVPVYHTNVMLTLGEKFAIICLEAIRDEEERKLVVNELEKGNREIIPISMDQMYAFAGNMLQVRSDQNKRWLIMSETAFKSLSPEQVNKIRSQTDFIYCSIPTIEQFGGGSVRCMMAEIFLPKRKVQF